MPSSALRSLSGFVGANLLNRVPPSRLVTVCAVGMMIVATLANEFVLNRLLSADGLDASSVSTIRWIQTVLFLIGIVLLARLRLLLLALFVGLAAGNLFVLHDQAAAKMRENSLVLDERLMALHNSLAASTDRVGYLGDGPADLFGFVDAHTEGGDEEQLAAEWCDDTT